MSLRQSIIVLLLVLAALSTAQEDATASYGVDCSIPIHNVRNADFESSCGDLLGDRKAVYKQFMEGCREQYGFNCDRTEYLRVEQMARRPQSLRNYTSNGYDKIRAPAAMMDLIKEHWERNQKNKDDLRRVEKWTDGHTYVNYWERNTTIYGMSNQECGGSLDLQGKMFDLAKPIMEEWTGMELEPTSLYGIRVYHEGAILMPHVDRNPLISSAIINVAQDPDMTEDWPLEVYGRDGQAVNISMVPGDMVLYESHSLIHGRPFPLQGKYYANVFIHFEPTGRQLKDKDNEDMQYGSPGNPAGYHRDTLLPPYIIPGSPEATTFVRFNPYGWGVEEPDEDDDDFWDDGEDSWSDEDEDEEDWDEGENEEDGGEYDSDGDEEEVLDGSKSDDNEDDSHNEYKADPGADSSRKSTGLNHNTPSCSSDTDPTRAPAECLGKLAAEQQQQRQAVA